MRDPFDQARQEGIGSAGLVLEGNSRWVVSPNAALSLWKEVLLQYFPNSERGVPHVV